MNLTLSIDDDLLARARERATRRGTSINQMIREYLEEIASEVSPDEILAELSELWTTSNGDSSGRRWTRDELHERRGIH
jgi:hypothetical protein